VVLALLADLGNLEFLVDLEDLLDQSDLEGQCFLVDQ